MDKSPFDGPHICKWCSECASWYYEISKYLVRTHCSNCKRETMKIPVQGKECILKEDFLYLIEEDKND